jgi:hypothetical protein
LNENFYQKETTRGRSRQTGGKLTAIEVADVTSDNIGANTSSRPIAEGNSRHDCLAADVSARVWYHENDEHRRWERKFREAVEIGWMAANRSSVLMKQQKTASDSLVVPQLR